MSAAVRALAEVVSGRSIRYRRLWGSRPDNWRHAWLDVAGDDVTGGDVAGGGGTTGLQETLKGDQQRSTGRED
jgi:pSer/pThr/pTyr-binding forkhead associated (FHA) protein